MDEGIKKKKDKTNNLKWLKPLMNDKEISFTKKSINKRNLLEIRYSTQNEILRGLPST